MNPKTQSSSIRLMPLILAVGLSSVSLGQSLKTFTKLKFDSFSNGAALAADLTATDPVFREQIILDADRHDALAVAYDGHFMAKRTPTSMLERIGNIKQEVLLTSLIDKMKITLGDKEIKGLVIHYGLNAEMELVYALCPVAMKRNDVTRTYDFDEAGRTLYVIDDDDGDKLVTYSGGLAQWEDNLHEQSLYFGHVWVKRASNSDFSQVVQNFDRQSYCIPWSQIEAQVDANDDGTDKPTKIVLSSLGTAMLEDGAYAYDFRHATCTYLKNNAGRMLSPGPSTNFQMRAADLGTPCPPRCKKYADFWPDRR